MIINHDLSTIIKSYCKSNPNIENCGFIIEINNELQFLPIENKHPDSKNYFMISPKDYLAVKKQHKIKYLFHSHQANKSFSNVDSHYQKYHNMDMLLYIIESDEYKEIKCK